MKKENFEASSSSDNSIKEELMNDIASNCSSQHESYSRSPFDDSRISPQLLPQQVHEAMGATYPQNSNQFIQPGGYAVLNYSEDDQRLVAALAGDVVQFNQSNQSQSGNLFDSHIALPAGLSVVSLNNTVHSTVTQYISISESSSFILEPNQPNTYHELVEIVPAYEVSNNVISEGFALKEELQVSTGLLDNSSIEVTDDNRNVCYESDSKNNKKNLPHKKRIPTKLKCTVISQKLNSNNVNCVWNQSETINNQKLNSNGVNCEWNQSGTVNNQKLVSNNVNCEWNQSESVNNHKSDSNGDCAWNQSGTVDNQKSDSNSRNCEWNQSMTDNNQKLNSNRVDCEWNQSETVNNQKLGSNGVNCQWNQSENVNGIKFNKSVINGGESNGDSIKRTYQHHSCELCGSISTTQLDFFAHLKTHYEPTHIIQSSNDAHDGTSILHKALQDPISHKNRLPRNSIANCPDLIDISVVSNCATSNLGNDDQSTEASCNVDGDDADVIFLSHDASDNITCSRCGRVFPGQHAFQSHMRVSHSIPNESAEFSDVEDLMEDIRQVVSMNMADQPSSTIQRGWNEYDGNNLGSQQSMTNMGDSQRTDANLQGKKTFVNGKLQLQENEVTEGADNAHIVALKKQLMPCTEPGCDRAFKHRNSLTYHIRSHKGERKHPCQYPNCGKSFFASGALKIHMRLHSGVKPYKCQHCDKCFRQWGDLKYHVTSIHSNTKLFQCEFCGKDFARKYSLVVHRRIHTGEKNYTCEFCPAKFRAASYLQNHRRTHTGEKPFECELCDKRFRVRSDMKRHMKTHIFRTFNSDSDESEDELKSTPEMDYVMLESSAINLNHPHSDVSNDSNIAIYANGNSENIVNGSLQNEDIKEKISSSLTEEKWKQIGAGYTDSCPVLVQFVQR